MIAERFHIVPISQDGDLGADLTCDSINMRNYHKACLVFVFGTLTTASQVLTINSGATNAAISSALYFNYAWGGAAVGTAVAGSTASCDVLSDWTNAATLTITHGSYDNKMLVCEVNADDMDLANNEYFLTAFFDDPGTAVGTVDAWAILDNRYKSNRGGTALA